MQLISRGRGSLASGGFLCDSKNRAQVARRNRAEDQRPGTTRMTDANQRGRSGHWRAVFLGGSGCRKSRAIYRRPKALRIQGNCDFSPTS